MLATVNLGFLLLSHISVTLWTSKACGSWVDITSYCSQILFSRSVWWSPTRLLADPALFPPWLHQSISTTVRRVVGTPPKPASQLPLPLSLLSCAHGTHLLEEDFWFLAHCLAYSVILTLWATATWTKGGRLIHARPTRSYLSHRNV